jgi:hypothetical protein
MKGDFWILKIILMVLFLKYILIVAAYAVVGYIIYKICKFIKEKWGDNIEQIN